MGFDFKHVIDFSITVTTSNTRACSEEGKLLCYPFMTAYEQHKLYFCTVMHKGLHDVQ